MISLRTIAIAAAAAAFSLAGLAQAPVDHSAHHPEKAASAAGGMPMAGGAAMAGMEEQMKTMQEMHEKMMQAKTPEERSALMAEHMKVMQDGMAMMDKGAMMNKAAMKGKAGSTAARQAMMEKRMDMMQSMMQMMMDQMQQREQMAAPSVAK
jgi:hypothetical protein